MADPHGFLTTRDRELPARRPVPIRIRDWKEVYEEQPVEQLQRQAGRCMDCGIPFCHNGCPLGNLIPEWNDLARRGEWHDAIERLHEEFRRRIKTQAVPPDAETAPMLFWALLASGQIVMRKVDGWQTLSQPLDPETLDLAA